MSIDVVNVIFFLISIAHLGETIFKAWAIRKKQNSITKSGKQEAFSIVICAHNELENLKLNLHHVLDQNYSNFEVIVVLDRCEDESFEYLQPIFEKDTRLWVLSVNRVPEDFNPKKYAITQAIKLAKYDWIVLTDADCYPANKQWLDSYNNCINENTDFILGISPYIENKAFLSSFIGYETFHTASNYIAAAKMGMPYMAVGRNLAYRKSVFLDNNGFGDIKHITGGDDDLFVQKHANRLNTSVNLHADSLVYSYPKTSWKSYFKQKTRHLSVGKHYKPITKMILFLSQACHTCMWLTFIFLVSFKPDPIHIVISYSLLLVAKGLVSQYTSAKLHMNWSWVSYIQNELIFAIMLPIVGVKSQLTKKVKWN
jgi:poly-beta-1,6-N-acetyl-D-glucosamine synthase